MRPIALVTGARSPAALDIARDFVAAGYRVHMADSSPARLAHWSKAPAEVHRLAPPVQDPEGFRRDISTLVARLNPAIVVPTCEEVFHLAAAREEGVEIGALFAPDLVTLDRLHAKDRFISTAGGLGLDVPRTTLFTDVLDPSTIDLERVVFKARYSRFGFGALIQPSRESVAALRPTLQQPWIMQERVLGCEHSSYAVAREGKLVAFSAYSAPLRLSGGAGYAFVPATEAVTNRLLHAADVIAAAFTLTGQIAFDAIDDGERSWLIECNPRSTSGVHLLAGEGELARSMLGEPGIARGRGEPRQNLPMMLSYGLLDRSGAWPRLIGAKDIVGARGDRLPILGALMDAFSFSLQAMRHGATLAGATTRDIEWNGAS